MNDHPNPFHANGPTKVETVLDARDIAVAFIRREMDAKLGLRLLVVGLWDGPVADVLAVLGLPDASRCEVATSAARWKAVLESRATFDLVWVVGADRFRAMAPMWLPGFGRVPPEAFGPILVQILSDTCFAAGARVVILAPDPLLAIQGTRWAMVEGERFPQIDRTLVIATMNDQPPPARATPGPEPLA